MKTYTESQIVNAVRETFGIRLEDYQRFWDIINDRAATTPLPLPTLPNQLQRELHDVAASIHCPFYSAPEDQIPETARALEKALKIVVQQAVEQCTKEIKFR